MARPMRLLPLASLALLLCALLRFSATTAAVPKAADSQLADRLALVIVHIIKAASTLLPGLVVAGVGLGLYMQKAMSVKLRAGLAVLLLTTAVGVMAQRSAPSSPQVAVEADEEAAEGPIHSGEEVLMSDGSFVRLPDPSKTDGSPPSKDWPTALSQALVNAIAQGQEQVVVMFTRQGCPWCDKQIPVMQEAIRRRAGGAPAASAGAAVAFAGPGGAGSLLNAPLRVFVLDAQEFPQLMQQFQVDGFPTSLIFGPPKATPLMGRGFLDEETFEDICREAALATPEADAPAQSGRKRGRKRRGLFR